MAPFSYFIQVFVKDENGAIENFAYAVFDTKQTTRTGEPRVINVSDILMAMGYQGKVERVGYTVGLVNTRTGATSIAGVRASIDMGLTRTSVIYKQSLTAGRWLRTPSTTPLTPQITPF